MKINKLTLSCLLICAICASTLNSQTSFWEKINSKIINPPKGTPKTFAEIGYPGTFLTNNSGAMLLLFGNSGLPATPVPRYAYVSNDGGFTWEYQMPFTKFNGYQIFTYDISSSGKYFITGSFSIGGTDKQQPVYFFSKDGKTWDAINKSDLLDKNYFGIGSHSILEAKNRKLSDCINLYQGNIGDYDAVYELHKIYYPDGSIKVVKDDKYDETKRSTNMANFYSFQSATGLYVRGNPVGDYQRIREVYYTCEGTYFASLGGGVSMVSNDDISYKKYTSGLFTSTPAMREKYIPSCNALFGIGKIATNEIKLYAKTNGRDWEDTGYYSGVYSISTEPAIKYNAKTKRYYAFEGTTLLQSRLTYECNCIPKIEDSAPITPKLNCFDASAKVSTYGIDGIKIIGSEKFSAVVGEALKRIKSIRPDFYEQYIKNGGSCGNNSALKGITSECSRGVNTFDAELNIQLSFSSDNTYQRYLKCPEILAGIILHEARHVCQAHLYYTKYALNYIEFLKYYNKDLLTAQIFERDALNIGIQFIESAQNKYKEGSSEYDALASELQRLNKLYKSDYPDVNGDKVFDSKDIKDMNEGTLQEMAEFGTLITTKMTVLATSDNNSGNIKVDIKYGTVKTLQGSNLNLRKEPSEKATIINKVPSGTKVKILREDDKIVTVNGEKGTWLNIEYEGVVGWAWGNFIVKE